MKKPSERIAEIEKKLERDFNDKYPFFFTDHGYRKDFFKYAVMEYLDEQHEEWGVMEQAEVECTDPNCDIPEPGRSKPHSHWMMRKKPDYDKTTRKIYEK